MEELARYPAHAVVFGGSVSDHVTSYTGAVHVFWIVIVVSTLSPASPVSGL